MNTRLVLQAQRRDKDAFVTLIGLYRESMYQIAYAILKNNEDAADAMQDTILICWESTGATGFTVSAAGPRT